MSKKKVYNFPDTIFEVGVRIKVPDVCCQLATVPQSALEPSGYAIGKLELDSDAVLTSPCIVNFEVGEMGKSSFVMI